MEPNNITRMTLRYPFDGPAMVHSFIAGGCNLVDGISDTSLESHVQVH